MNFKKTFIANKYFYNEDKLYILYYYYYYYVDECQIIGFLYNVELLQTYLIQYGNQNLFENEIQTQLVQKHLEKHLYLYSNMKNE